MQTSSSLASSFWGRTWLLTKLSFVSTRRNLLLFHLFVGLIALGLPYVVNLLTTLDPLEALQELIASYSFGGLSSVYFLATTVYLLLWLHRLTHQQTPGGYALIPASVGEKLTSIALLMAGYQLLSLAITTVLTALFSWLSQGRLFVEFLLLFGAFSEVPLRWVGPMLLALLFPYLMTMVLVVHCRRSLVAFLVSGAINTLLLLLAADVLSHLAAYPTVVDYARQLTEPGMAVIFSVVFLLADLALGGMLYLRLKTLQLP